MQEIFENYLAIVLGEKELPKQSRVIGMSRALLQKSLFHYVNLGGGRPKELLEMVRQGVPNARRLLIDAAVKGHEEQFRVFTEYENSRELVNV